MLFSKIDVMDKIDKLPIEQYQEFHQAIMTDNDVYVLEILTQNKDLINARFDFSVAEDANLSKSLRKKGETQPHYALTLAISKASIKVVQVLLELGADVQIKEADGYNIIHVLLLAASQNAHVDKQFLDIYKIVAGDDTITGLLLEESEDGLRPLEMAACLGLMNFTKRIMNTPEVYLAKSVTKGAIIYKWYDVTDYEKLGLKSRKDRSPLFFLRNIDKDILLKKETSEFCEWSVIQQWINNKVFCNLPLAILWFLQRLLYIGLICVLDLTVPESWISAFNTNQANDSDMVSSENISEANDGSCRGVKAIPFPINQRFWATFGIVLASAIFVCYDVLNFLTTRCTAKPEKAIRKLRGKGSRAVVSTPFFRIMHFIFCLSVGFKLSIKLILLLGGFTQPDYNVTELLVVCWSLLYFMQLMEQIGYLVVILEKLVMETFRLLILALAIYVPFVIIYLRLYTQAGICDVILMDDLLSVLYDVFLINFNMITFKPIPGAGGVIYGVHMLYVLLISIILMNLIIAIYSEIVSQLAPHRMIISKLQRLSIMLVVESRLKVLFYPYHLVMQKFSSYELVDSRIFIVDVSTSDVHTKSFTLN